MFRLSNSSLVIEKCLIKCPCIETLKSNGRTCERDAGGFPPSPTNSGVRLALLFCLLLSARDWARPCRGTGGVRCSGALHTLNAKSQIYCESPRPCQDQPMLRSNSRERKYANICKYATLPLDEMSRGQAYALAFLQLSANPAVASTAPALSPTNASAKKAGTGDTAIKVSDKQTLRALIGVLHIWCYTEMTASRAFPASLTIPHSIFSNL